jgi:23S rRNA pseudouridine2605 synthase
MPSEGDRLQKVMARAGIASRRACEAIILAGRVTVNDRTVTELGTRVSTEVDRIAVDGSPLVPAEALAYVALYKPVGYLSSQRDPHAHRLVADLVPQSPRVYPVGRLDRDSEGLLLFTNDGDLALRLMHPRYQQEKEYRVLVRGTLSTEDRARLAEGIRLEGKPIPGQATVVELPTGWCWRDEPVPAGHQWAGLILREGHKREIREMLATLGLPVRRLIRIRIGSLELGSLRAGEHRSLATREIAALHRLTGLDGMTEERDVA